MEKLSRSTLASIIESRVYFSRSVDELLRSLQIAIGMNLSSPDPWFEIAHRIMVWECGQNWQNWSETIVQFWRTYIEVLRLQVREIERKDSTRGHFHIDVNLQHMMQRNANARNQIFDPYMI